ncbi:MAG: hypothetical protein SOU80_06665 [Alphaproteobacteria bacterium]|nr:hypothetical protein [Alphaproteobacteria bacterium]
MKQLDFWQLLTERRFSGKISLLNNIINFLFLEVGPKELQAHLLSKAQKICYGNIFYFFSGVGMHLCRVRLFSPEGGK